VETIESREKKSEIDFTVKRWGERRKYRINEMGEEQKTTNKISNNSREAVLYDRNFTCIRKGTF